MPLLSAQGRSVTQVPLLLCAGGGVLGGDSAQGGKWTPPDLLPGPLQSCLKVCASMCERTCLSI